MNADVTPLDIRLSRLGLLSDFDESMARDVDRLGLDGSSSPEIVWSRDVLYRLAEEVERLRAALQPFDRLARFIEQRGYRRCDIPACNCDSFHHGHAETRLREISDILGERTQGVTLCTAVANVVEDVERLTAEMQRLQSTGA